MAAGDVTVVLGSLTTMTAPSSGTWDTFDGTNPNIKFAEVDNTSNKYIDVLVWYNHVQPNTGSIGDAKAVYVYAGGSGDSTLWTGDDDPASAGVGNYLNSPPNHLFLGRVNVPAINDTYVGGPWSLAQAFGGWVPSYWSIYCLNSTDVSINVATSVPVCKYQGIKANVAAA